MSVSMHRSASEKPVIERWGRLSGPLRISAVCSTVGCLTSSVWQPASAAKAAAMARWRATRGGFMGRLRSAGWAASAATAASDDVDGVGGEDEHLARRGADAPAGVDVADALAAAAGLVLGTASLYPELALLVEGP